MERRTFLQMLIGGSLLGFLFGSEKGNASNLIRPPGAEPEETFLAACARCGKCAEICPRGAINIAHGEHGLSIGTPYLVPQENYCDLCMKCTEICPTGALKPIAPEDVRMGLAEIDYGLCLARKDEDCRVCHANCPMYDKAIWLENNKYPVVNPDYCTGCGCCENVCIASPQKAISVKPRPEV